MQKKIIFFFLPFELHVTLLKVRVTENTVDQAVSWESVTAMNKAQCQCMLSESALVQMRTYSALTTAYKNSIQAVSHIAELINSNPFDNE